ncbi:MAG: ribosome biogenesis GTPase Der [Patescibacteria group bacterium]|jgi:GTP-binding protein
MKKTSPVVAIVGRTNAGKSTLFNRLSETRKAIVSPMENTTRDRNYAEIAWNGKSFMLVDTGGLDTAPKDALSSGIQKQVKLAIEEADMILFIVDGRSPIMPQDKELAAWLKKLKKPVILGINKIDNKKNEKDIDPDFTRLNFTDTVKFSSINGSRTGELLDLITDKLPASATIKEKNANAIHLAIVGRPNVGKSSLINAIMGQEKVLVSPLPHTTRDINDLEFVYNDRQFILVDTAGLRRKSRVGDWPNKMMGKIEKEGVRATIETIRRANVVALVLESQERITSQDQALVDLCIQERKNLILVVNKWDLIEEKDENTINDFVKYFDAKLPFARHVPMIFVSALEKLRVKKMLDLTLEIEKQANLQADQEDLDKIIEELLRKYKPRQRQTVTFGQEKKPLVIKRLTQERTNPPVFHLQTPTPKNFPEAIAKLIEKALRDRYEFLGIPIKIFISK